MLIVNIWFFISAHKWFKGPRINIEHHMLGRDAVVEGVEGSSESDAQGPTSKKAVFEGSEVEPMSEVIH
jgi:hypothetical protein